MGGTRRNLELAKFMHDEWKVNFIDKVYLKEYYVYLSYPRKPANVTLLSSDRKIMFQAKTTEQPFFKEENDTEIVYPFNAYSASGDVEVKGIVSKAYSKACQNLRCSVLQKRLKAVNYFGKKFHLRCFSGF